jgi:ABC-type dipeptide/oligopeptide/nickel transport system ATPase component
MLGPSLYLLYTHDVPQTANTKIATFADDTAVMAVGENIEEATDQLLDQAVTHHIKRDQISSREFYQPQSTLYWSNHQWSPNTTFEHDEVSRNDAQCQTTMERACKKENRRT